MKPEWNAACEAMRWLNDIEAMQGGRNGPTIKLRAAIEAIQTEKTALLCIKKAADVLYSEAEKYDLPDGLGMGASQEYWDDLANALFPDDSDEVIQADLEKVQLAVDRAWEAFNEELNKPEFLPCGHHHSLMLKSAETGEPLYCELCDCISMRNDFETELNETKSFVVALQGLHAGDIEMLKSERDALRALLTRASKSLIDVVRMPNIEHVADDHNAVVLSIRAALAAKGE